MSDQLGIFPAREDQLVYILDALARRADELGVLDSRRAKLYVVLEELFLNTVRHGGVTGSLEAAIVLEREDDVVRLIYEDSSHPHNPFLHHDRRVLTEEGAERRVGGLGVILVVGLATTAHYVRASDRNRVTLTFGLPPLSS